MPIRPIVRYPDPLLRERCTPIEGDFEDLESLVRDMAETMYAADGAGLAAIQIGVTRQVYIVDPGVAGLAASDDPMVFVNPQIVWKSAEKELADEGCLSFPGIYVPVERSLRCRTRALDVHGEPFEIEGEGLFARAMQHEYDHLTGKLLADYVGRIKRRMIERRLLREAEDEAAAG